MTLKQCLSASALALLPLVALAQPATPGGQPDDAAAPVAAPAYSSQFAGYTKWSDESASPAARWRDANNEVAALGGHAGHMREKQAAKNAPPQPAQPAQPGRSARSANGANHHGGHN